MEKEICCLVVDVFIFRLFGIADVKEQDKSVDDTHVKKRNLKGWYT